MGLSLFVILYSITFTFFVLHLKISTLRHCNNYWLEFNLELAWFYPVVIARNECLFFSLVKHSNQSEIIIYNTFAPKKLLLYSIQKI